MKKIFSLKNTGIALIAMLLLSQLISIDKSIQPINASVDFISLHVKDTATASLIKETCYDCHSNQPRYPWYTSVAPVSWWIKHHINEGSAHLNFSNWGNYAAGKQDHKLEECVEMVLENEMPMSSYTWMHSSAKLNTKQKQHLIDFFNSLRTNQSEHEEHD